MSALLKRGQPGPIAQGISDHLWDASRTSASSSLSNCLPGEIQVILILSLC